MRDFLGFETMTNYDSRKNAALSTSMSNTKLPIYKEREHLMRYSLIILVEARGVEPLSEGIATKASTGVAT
jgi:hypothetical protein